MAQNPISKATNASLKNYWKGQFLEFGGGSAILSPTDYNSWELLPVPNVPECVYIKLKGQDMYLNIENGLKISAIQPAWYSAMWQLEKVNGEELYRIINYWTKLPLHSENSSLDVSKAEPGWLSARWQLSINDAADKTTTAPIPFTPLETMQFSLGEANFEVEIAEDGGTTPAIYGDINIRLLKNGAVVNTWPIFSRSGAAGSRVLMPEKQKHPLAISAPTFTVNKNELSQYAISLEAHLKDYDISGDDDLGNTGKTLNLADVGTTSQNVSVELYGEGKTVVRMKVFPGKVVKESVYNKIINDPHTDVKWVPLNYESVALSVAQHINGLAMNENYCFVNFPTASNKTGRIYWSKTGDDWSDISFDMVNKLEGQERYPSGMQLANSLLAVADNNYARLFYFAGNTLAEIPDLKIALTRRHEITGLVYHPYFRRYFLAAANKIYCSPADTEPYFNGNPNPGFFWESLYTTGTEITMGEAGMALLYDEQNPKNIVCLSLGSDIITSSYQYTACTITITEDGANKPISAAINTPFSTKTLTPPSGIVFDGSGPSFRWGGTAYIKNGSVIIVAAPKRLDNAIKNASNLCQWTLW